MERNSNVFKFQGSNMIVSAKGPNIDRNMNISASFRSNLLSSTMNMPRNFEKQSSATSVASQKSLYYGRETSPTGSVRSDMQPRNFHQSFYHRGFPQRSVYSGRGGSPVSMRSIDSSASLATDIAQAINNGNFSRQEWKMIQQAVSRSNRRKYDYRKKAERRRKMKMYFKNLRNGDDSGEQGSNSSISSDDGMSTRTGYSHRYDRNYKENIPRSTTSLDRRSEDIFQRDNRETYGYSEIDSQNPYQRNINSYNHENNYQKDSQFGNIYSSHKNGQTYNKSTLYSQNKSMSGPMNTFLSQKYMNGQANTFSTQRSNLNASICSTKSMQNMSVMSQKDRFKGGFQFPSQKFNKSSTLHEEHDQVRGKQFPYNECANSRRNLREEHINEHSDENDDIVPDIVKPTSVAKKSETRQKRKLESLSDVPVSAKKKPKTTSSTIKAKKPTPNKNNNEKHDFEFIKPQFPIRKSAPAKPREKLISKSTGAPDLVFNDHETQKPPSEPVKPAEPASPEPDDEPELADNTQLTNCDVSMKPSFMKRKLFTQTLDVTERKNNSSDSLATDSPQSNIYSALCREKHKTRKLVTSQSLLSRDLNQDDNNLLDLIHKIVPANQVNATITANNTKSFHSRLSGNKNADSDKWDITSIISTSHNNESVSETYTDDEIFKVADDDKKNKPQEKPTMKKITPEDNKVPNGKPENKNTKQLKLVPKKVPTPTVPKMQTPVEACPKKVLPSNNIDDFWNTDVDSDRETAESPRRQNKINLHELTRNRMDSPKLSDTEIRPTSLVSKMTKINKTHESSPIVGKKNDTTLVQVLKKQTNKKMTSKPEHTLLKKSNDDIKSLKNTNDAKILIKSNDDTKTSKKANDVTTMRKANEGIKFGKKSSDNIKTLKKSDEVAKTSKKTNNDATQQNDKPDKVKKGTPTITLKTRRQINLSATLGSVKKPCIDKKVLSPKKVTSIKTKISPSGTEKKATQEKNNKTKTTRKKQNDSRHQVNSSKQLERTPKSQSKVTNVQNSVENLNDTICKRLRTRVIDLSSSFNSDKFELTMSRTRKSRTPSKRISTARSKLPGKKK